MRTLNRIIAYWYDCVKNEDILEKDISIYSRSKAVLYPFNYDPFIFDRKDNLIPVSDNEKITTFSKYITTQGYEAYYGYPVLFYFDNISKKYLIAPLFIIKVNFVRKNNELYIQKNEQFPTCGVQAFNKLGFRTEEIASISESIENIFKKEFLNGKSFAEKCLNQIQKETELPFNESIDPNNLTNSKKISRNMTPGLYNKSIIFVGENSFYNISLLQDLKELKSKDDLHKTALSFITEEATSTEKNNHIPILPFPSNKYQTKALQDAFKNKLSVITGPPGTGKSQFISNLLINLFLEGKSVLFVSHTNEAVNVVYRKINEQFQNLMLRTGNKKFRQQLQGKLNELILDSEKKSYCSIELKDLHLLWETMLKHSKSLIELDKLEQKFQKMYYYYKNMPTTSNPFSKLVYLFKKYLLYFKLRLLKNNLNKLPSKIKIQEKIKNLEQDYFKYSAEFIRSIYIHKMMSNTKNMGKVKAFLNQVNSNRIYDDDNIDYNLFANSLQILKLWSSTLKSIRRTFPLAPGIFDYVIFDESSQIDLPSAAPALYRAKKAIVVGDPMQLTHIATITKDLDKKIAKNYGLTTKKTIYPSRTRYCDISLYKSAENSLNGKPLLLINHYRSEDQIIDLCNQVFYQGRLKIMTALDYSKYPHNLPLGIQWIDCKGEAFKHPAGSRVNYIEAKMVNKIFQDVLQKISGTDLSIGIVTPYSRQQNAIYKIISQATPIELLEKHKVKILTAHKFQGSEKDIMIFSLVTASRGNGNNDRWYNIYPQILNVALSRAKYLLYIIGDKNFCKNRSGILKKLAQTYDDIKKNEEIEEYTLYEKFDSPAEKFLFQKLQEIDFTHHGYRLIPKLVAKRYTLDFALLGNKKINIECDGYQHQIIEGIPVIEDVERDEFLKKEGWEILRFPNHKILSQTDKVINDILKTL